MNVNLAQGVSPIALIMCAAAAACLSTPAAAQDVPNPASAGAVPQTGTADTGDTAGPEGDIIVTAEKRSEDRKDVPASLEVISGDRLEANGVQNGLDVVKYLPGFGLDSSAEVRTVTLKTRGIGTFTSSYALNWVGNKILVDLRKQMFAHLMRPANQQGGCRR